MGNTSGTGDKQKAAAKATKDRFEHVWRQIKEWSAEQCRIDLTIAANLTGFCLFPVGWSWTEVPIKKASARFPLHEKAKTTGRLGIQSNEPSTPEGIHAAGQGEEFRRAEVSRRLLRMIWRQEIPAFLQNAHDEFLPITDQVRLFYDLNIDMRKSIIGMHDLKNAPSWYAETDAETLVSALDKKRAWDTNESINDWLVFERISRSEIERCGLPHTKKLLFDKTLNKLDEYKPEAHSPNRTEALDLISRLYKEYGNGDVAESEN